ncbi:hypothetical protein XU18_4122 [Perkinsela sp. CCAP 1560/4]|nr:hypothetical protein XU18_4122 [Perkinsela sp. CCAP 1560/4]|eukprot:KNH04684.1 hypothetical protein XU18_4122 [Perkinsela sp. CCAP 1560/4]
MEKISVWHNKWSGSLKLDSLPDLLKYIYANGNQVSGSVDLTQLPAGLMYLHLENNRLSGLCIFTHISEGVRPRVQCLYRIDLLGKLARRDGGDRCFRKYVLWVLKASESSGYAESILSIARCTLPIICSGRYIPAAASRKM